MRCSHANKDARYIGPVVIRECRMFHDHPEARQLFARVGGDNTYSPEFEAHSQRILGGLDNCISLLDEPPTLAAELEHLKAQHADRGIGADYYDVSHRSFSLAIINQ